MGVQMIDTVEAFEKLVKKAAGDKLVVVDFFATWCGPCKVIGPKLEAMSAESEFSNVLFFKVDVDELETVAAECGISAMPTFKFFRGGKEVGEVVGASEGKIRELIKANK